MYGHVLVYLVGGEQRFRMEPGRGGPRHWQHSVGDSANNYCKRTKIYVTVLNSCLPFSLEDLITVTLNKTVMNDAAHLLGVRGQAVTG